MEFRKGTLEDLAINTEFWNNKKVLLTGHTGFKGSWLSLWLQYLGTELVGYSLPPPTQPSLFELSRIRGKMKSIEGDVRDYSSLKKVIVDHQPEIVIHLAAQSLVRRSYLDPIETYTTNVMGTVHLLEAVRQVGGVKVVLNVTSDKCYENRETEGGYREDDPMGGHDPYSSSKGCAELATASYRRSFFRNSDPSVGVATVRAGNVIGGGDWAEDRLVPDAVRALHRKKPLILRSPGAKRPWQHVLEPLAGYLALAERLYTDGEKWATSWNFGPRDTDAVTVGSLCDILFRLWGKGNWRAESDRQGHHEAHYLRLDSSKAKQLLGWQPLLTLQEAVEMTVAWYTKAFTTNFHGSMYDFSREQIRNYMNLAKSAKI